MPTCFVNLTTLLLHVWVFSALYNTSMTIIDSILTQRLVMYFWLRQVRNVVPNVNYVFNLTTSLMKLIPNWLQLLQLYQPCRACDYGLPQGRPRLYLVGIRQDVASARSCEVMWNLILNIYPSCHTRPSMAAIKAYVDARLTVAFKTPTLPPQSQDHYFPQK